jgi:alpha-methylacyl-CoA racemase
MAGPLSGVTLIELAGIGPAPFAGMMLADMGADIIRIDRLPSGDGGVFGELLRNDGIVDRGRRSLAVNMKDPRGVQAVLRLVERADGLMEGFRPGVADKLGLGPDACLARNPRLVYGRMTGWGQTGPLAQAAGHDINYIALTGVLHSMGPRDRPPAPPLNLVGDYGGGGMLLALGMVAALFETARSGRGQVIDAAMTDGSALLMAMMHGQRAKGLWGDARESNFLDGAAHFYGAYECADGKYVSIGPIEPQFYAELLRRLAIEDAAFQQQWSASDWPALKARLAAVFATRTRDEWTALLEGSDVCFAPVLDLAEAPLHPHNVARGTFVESHGTMQPAPAPRFDRTVSEMPLPAPRAGDHSLELLKQAGLSDAEADDLLSAGVVHQSVRGAAER